MRNRSYILVLLIMLVCPGISLADPVHISVEHSGFSSGKSSFFLCGEDVLGVAALDIEIGYDSTLLSKPVAVVDGGYVAKLTSDSPGTLHMSIVRPEPHGILQIFLEFNARSETPGGIYAVRANSTQREEWKSPNQNVPADVPATSEAQSSPESDSVKDTGKQRGSDALAESPSPGTSPLKIPAATVIGSGNDNSPAGKAAQQIVIARNYQSYPVDPRNERILREEKSVLERFRRYDGEIGLKALAALFKRTGDAGNTQRPPIALSDGTSSVTISIKLNEKPNGSPGVALFDAKLVSVHKEDDATLVIVVVPSRDTADARLVLVTGTETLEFPLVVAPTVAISGNTNENNFVAGLNKYLSDQDPNMRLKEKSYLYKYIFTANYLARSMKTGAGAD